MKHLKVCCEFLSTKVMVSQLERLNVFLSTVVSRAFQVLSDADKKQKYDRFGGDPDNRFAPGAASTSSPFSGFARSPSSGRGPMFEDEISPEELFNRFFGGGMGGGMGGPGFGMYAAKV